MKNMITKGVALFVAFALFFSCLPGTMIVAQASISRYVVGFLTSIESPDPNATVITTATELAAMQSGRSYVLGNDIELSSYI